MRYRGVCGMEKKPISSFGSIVIPISMRKELGIDGNMMVSIGVRDLQNGEKEIVIRKPLGAEDVLNKYKTWSEVISRVAESSVALVWNNKLLSLSSSSYTESFIKENLIVNPILTSNMMKSPNNTIVNNPEEVSLICDGPGEVAAYYRIKSIEEGNCYFVVVRGSKIDKALTKAEEKRRYMIINDIVDKI